MGALKLELWALPRDGQPYPLPHVERWQVSPRDDEPGVLEFSYPEVGRYYERLAPIVDNDVDLDVEATLWSEDGRYWRDIFKVDSADLDDVDELGVATFTGLQQSTVFDEVVIPYYPTPAGAEGQGETPASGNAGLIARQFLTAAKGRGCLEGITWTFTDSHDSNGVAWARTSTLRFNPGQTYRAMLGTLRGYQLAEWELTSGGELRLVNVSLEDGYGIGTDRTTGPRPLTLERGRDLGDAPRKWRIRGAITALFSSGKDGIYTSASNTTARARRGRRIEGYRSFGNTADRGTLEALTQRQLNTQIAGKVEVSHKVVLGPRTPTPLIDYLPGDRIFSATRAGVSKRRVRQITVQGESHYATEAAVACGDLLDDVALRQQQQIDQMASGEVGVGTSVPPPETDDGSIPAAPEGLTVSSLWYATNEGSGAAQATAVWQPVPDARVDGYLLQWRYPGSMDWSPIGPVPETSVSWSGLRPGQTAQARVAALNKWGRYSAWSNAVTFVPESDGTPPPVPSTPAPFPSLGLVVVPWDGRGSAGEPMSLDFLSVEVHASPTSNFTPHRPLVAGTKKLDAKASSTYVGELRAGGELPVDVGVAAYGTTMFVRLVAVDRTGNASTASGQGSTVPQPVQDGEIAELGVGKLRTGILTALVAVAGKLYAGAPDGAGWEADAAGFRFYGMIGNVRTALLEFIAATATLTMRGQFEARGTGQARIGIFPEALPIIRLWAQNTAHGPAFINAMDIGPAGSAGLGLNSGPSNSSPTPAQRFASRLWLRSDAASYEFVNGSQVRRGGAVDITPTSLLAEHRRTDGTRSATLKLEHGLAELAFWYANGTDVLSRITLSNDGSVIVGTAGNNFLQLTTNDATLWRNGVAKSFVIPHPLDDPDRPERWLVHACTESPVAGVEYAGTVDVDGRAVVELPDYFEALVEDEGRTVQLTVEDDERYRIPAVAASRIAGGRFAIRTDADGPVRVHWHVRGARRNTSFEVEPSRDAYHAHGDGPYRYLTACDCDGPCREQPQGRVA